MSAEERFKLAVRAVVAAGTYPSPRAIRLTLGRRVSYRSAGGDILNGRETRWRRETLTALGWTERPLSRRPIPRHAWAPPA